MSNMSRTALLDRILPSVGLDAIFDRDADEIGQLLLEPRNVEAVGSQPCASATGLDQPVTVAQISELLINFRAKFNQDIER